MRNFYFCGEKRKEKKRKEKIIKVYFYEKIIITRTILCHNAQDDDNKRDGKIFIIYLTIVASGY